MALTDLKPRLWLPASVRKPRKGEKVRICKICGSRFPAEPIRRFVSHVEKCYAQTGEADVMAHIEMQEASPLTSITDKEAWNWGRKRAAEGKVGFKHGRPA